MDASIVLDLHRELAALTQRVVMLELNGEGNHKRLEKVEQYCEAQVKNEERERQVEMGTKLHRLAELEKQLAEEVE